MIRTKAAVTTAELGEQFCMIGPYNEKFVHLEVEPTEPDLSITREVLAQMRSHKLKVCDCLPMSHVVYKGVDIFTTGDVWSLAHRWIT